MQRSLSVLIALVFLFLTVGCNLNRESDFQKGLEAYEEKDYKTALREWRPLAELGLAKAQFNLGQMYRKGEGVPQDFIYAHMWFNVAASQGHENGANNRDLLAKEMTPSQIAKAQELARECVKKKFKGCD